MKFFYAIFCFGLVCLIGNKTLLAQPYQVHETLNISYLTKEKIAVDSLQQFNLVMPEGVEHPPLLLWIGGGAWSFVNRHMEMDLARQFAKVGIAVASVGHRLSKGSFSPNGKDHGVQHPKHIEDVAAAFAFIKNSADTYGYDGDNIFVGGFSSGAHLAALLATNPKFLEPHGMGVDQIRGILPIAGTYDIQHYHDYFKNHEDSEVQLLANDHVKDVFGDGTFFAEASPVNYLSNLSCPMLVVSDNALFIHTDYLQDILRENPVEPDCFIFHDYNYNHGDLWRNLSNAEQSQTRSLMVDFIRKNLKQE